MEPDKQFLIKLAHTKMPFGKYEGWHLIDLPEYYVVWYSNKGFPKGELGRQLQLVYELKLNGLVLGIDPGIPMPRCERGEGSRAGSGGATGFLFGRR